MICETDLRAAVNKELDCAAPRSVLSGHAGFAIMLRRLPLLFPRRIRPPGQPRERSTAVRCGRPIPTRALDPKAKAFEGRSPRQQRRIPEVSLQHQCTYTAYS